MYSPVAGAPNHHQMTSENDKPQPIHTADSTAASLVLISCASRCTTSRSISSSVTMMPSSAAQCQNSTSSSTKLPVESSAASTTLETSDIRARLPVVPVEQYATISP